LIAVEIALVSLLILATRCANYRDVFVRGNIYFVDADCYARMTRVRLCAQHPGLILRHHNFENFPDGTTPHTTAPLDYAILLFSFLLRPFTARSIEFAGAFISPVLALISGLFLWWWSRKMRFRFRWAMLILFGLSPILVHATALGRPDHQSLVLLLVIIAICAEWSLLSSDSTGWKLVNGLAWGFAIWVSAYEPLLLLLIISATSAVSLFLRSRKTSTEPVSSESLTDLSERWFPFWKRQLKWLACGAVLLVALAVERRFPSLPVFANDLIFRNWSRTIGELAPVPLLSATWFNWLGWLVIAAPFLLLLRRNKDGDRIPLTITILLIATFLLTLWQARWAYFFAALFVMVLPKLLGVFRSSVVAWILFIGSLWPILRDWDARIWPNPLTAARQIEQRQEAIGLRELSNNMISAELRPFLAPWWLSPAVAYWSGQPALAGSSHESLPGIADSAQFFLTDPVQGGEILRRRQVAWVISYDAERVERNSSAILGKKSPENSLARVLDQRPAQAPGYLTLSVQTGTEKLFQVTNKW